MLQDSNEIKLSLKDRILHRIFIVKDKDSGKQRIRNSDFARRFMHSYSKKRFKELKRKSYKFDLSTIIQYPREFAIKFKESNRPFVININKEQEIDLQLIHPTMIEFKGRENVDEFGFTIHLPFDTTQEDAIKEMSILKKKEYFSQFAYQSNDGIEDYILDCSENYDLLDSMLRNILVDLKGYNESDEIVIDHFLA